MTGEKSLINADYRHSCAVVIYKLHNANKVSEKTMFWTRRRIRPGSCQRNHVDQCQNAILNRSQYGSGCGLTILI